MLVFDYYLDDEHTGTIRVQPHDNATARAFISAMRQTSGETTDVNHSFFRDKSEIVNSFLRLKEVVRLMNATSYDRKIEVDIESGLSPVKLAKLHQFFEDIGERIRSGTVGDVDFVECWTYGQELNHLIHRLEGSETESSWMQATFSPFTRIEMTDEILSEGKKDYQANRLYIGFAETGKNLWHGWIDNEIDLIKRGMVQPQRAVTSEFFFSLTDINMDWNSYEEWCIKNNSSVYGYDHTDIKYYGKWEVGVMKHDYNKNTFPEYNKIRYREE